MASWLELIAVGLCRFVLVFVGFCLGSWVVYWFYCLWALGVRHGAATIQWMERRCRKTHQCWHARIQKTIVNHDKPINIHKPGKQTQISSQKLSRTDSPSATISSQREKLLVTKPLESPSAKELSRGETGMMAIVWYITIGLSHSVTHLVGAIVIFPVGPSAFHISSDWKFIQDNGRVKPLLHASCITTISLDIPTILV